MTLLQGILIIIACFILAVAAGIYVGRTCFKKWSHPFLFAERKAATGDEISPVELQHPVVDRAARKQAAEQAKREAEEERCKVKAEEEARKETEKLTRKIAKREAEQLRHKAEAEEKARKEIEKSAIRKAQQEAKQDRMLLKAEEQARREAEKTANRKVEQEAKGAAEQADAAAREQARREAERSARERAQREAWERSQQEAWERTQLIRREAEELAREKAEPEPKIAAAQARQAVETTDQVKKTVAGNGILSEASLTEIRTNLAIATSPWTGKPSPFLTSIINTNPGVFDVLDSSRRSDLREAYTDMAMANNIVWLITDLGTNSKELEDSYVKLCTKIAERLTKVLQP
jgi:hypothetical protein